MPSDRKHITAILEEEKEVKDFIYGGKRAGSQPPSHPQKVEKSLLGCRRSLLKNYPKSGMSAGLLMRRGNYPMGK